MKNIQLHLFELQQQVQDSPHDQDLRAKLFNYLSECPECAEYLKLSYNIQNAAQIRFTNTIREARTDAQIIDSVKHRLLHRQFYNRLYRPLPGIAWLIVAILLVVIMSWGIMLLRSKLILPISSSTQTPTSTPSPTEVTQAINECRNITYTIAEGDTIFAIASYFNVTPDTIYRGNNLENNPVLMPGKSLVIPFCGWSPTYFPKNPDQYGVPPIKACQLVSYTVQQGDTLEAISVAFNVPVASIVNDNQLKNGSVLSHGKSLVITLCKKP